MRIVLKKGKQRELIYLAKNKLTWKELGKLLNCPTNYLNNDLRSESIYISYDICLELYLEMVM